MMMVVEEDSFGEAEGAARREKKEVQERASLVLGLMVLPPRRQ